MPEQYIPTAISYHQMIAGGGLHSPVVRREAARYSQHLVERTPDHVCVPRWLAADVVEFLERIVDSPWYSSAEGCEEIQMEAGRLVRAWSDKPSTGRETVARALAHALLEEAYGDPHEEMAPTGEVF